MNKHIRNLSLVLAGFASAVAFQNCSPAKLVDTTPVSNEKPEVVIAEPEVIAPVADIKAPLQEVSLSSKLLKNRKWILDSYSEGNDEIFIDESTKIRFEMSANSVADSDRVCAGDCGRAFPIAGSSICGEFSGYMKVRFIESLGAEALSIEISDLEDVCKTEDIIDGESAVSVIDQIFQDLENSDQISLNNRMLIIRSENRTAIFKADKSF